jgi:hypothetical protein
MTVAVLGTDLGVCGAFVDGGVRCEGRLIVERQLGVLVEAECDSCGGAAARPVAKPQLDSEERREPWWND